MADLAIVIGASSWPLAGEDIVGSSGFEAMAERWREFLHDGLRVAPDDLLWLFNSPMDARTQMQEMSAFLTSRVAMWPDPTLWLYYVGHGSFYGSEQRYSLLVRATESRLGGLTSIAFPDLADLLADHAPDARKLLVLDCCFASSATRHFQAGSVEEVMARKLDDDSGTMFSSALLDVLDAGDPSYGERLTLYDVANITWARIRALHQSKAIRPQLHSPDQRDGDVAAIPLFVNRAYRPTPPPELRLVPSSIELGEIVRGVGIPVERIVVLGGTEADWTAESESEWVRIERHDDELRLNFTPTDFGVHYANVHVRVKDGPIYRARISLTLVEEASHAKLVQSSGIDAIPGPLSKPKLA